jgi:AAA ATPase containing von Willebrand factor type A (vWA) domain
MDTIKNVANDVAIDSSATEKSVEDISSTESLTASTQGAEIVDSSSRPEEISSPKNETASNIDNITAEGTTVCEYSQSVVQDTNEPKEVQETSVSTSIQAVKSEEENAQIPEVQDQQHSEQSSEPKESESVESKSKESEPVESEPVESESKESEPKESEPKESEPKVSEPNVSEAPIENLVGSHLNESITQTKDQPEISEPVSEHIQILTKPDTDDIQPLSDDDIIIDGVLSSDSDSASESESDSDSDSDSDSSSDSDTEKQSKDLDYDVDDDEGETVTGPIVSKNEVANEVAPGLPEGYVIPENSPIELIGEVIGLVEQSMIIKANISGEFRVLKDQSVICFEDRTVVGPLFETFGRLQQPIYRVKFNSVEDFEKFKDCKGKQAYYVVPDSQFVYTDSIKHMRGTDASNCHDEELPEEEQEFSDDERELEARQAKKKKNKNKNKDSKQIGEGADQKKDVRNNRKRQNYDKSEIEQPKKFQPYGYAQPQIPAVPNFPSRNPPVTSYTPISKKTERPGVYQYTPIHNSSQPGQPQLPPQPQQPPQLQQPQNHHQHHQLNQFIPQHVQPQMPQNVQQPLSSAYGVPFSQVQQSFSTTGHQTYNQYGQPAYGNNYNQPQFQQQGAYQGNQNFPPNQQGSERFPPNQQWIQPPPHQQPPQGFQQPPQGFQQPQQNQLQPSQLEQLQQLIVNQLHQQQQGQQNFPPQP